MYKILNSRINCKTDTNNTNAHNTILDTLPIFTNKNTINNNNIYSTLVNQDIEKMYLLPPHCPLYPNEYSHFFNNNAKLKPLTPYKLKEIKHPKDGKKYQRLEYNNFYSDLKQNSLKWYPIKSNTTEYSELNTNHINQKQQEQINNIARMTEQNMTLYEQTRRKQQFAKPLATNGTNQLNILFNDKCVNPTFNYKHYSSMNINNTKWFNNPLYNKDISQETHIQNAKYMDNIVQNGMDLYSSVFEDMYLLGYNPHSKNDEDNRINM
jgi:hypothetical protein